MLEIMNRIGLQKAPSKHQREMANIFEKNVTNFHHTIERNREIPKNAISCFEESFVIKKGFIVTTGVDIYVSQKDAMFFKGNENSDKFETEVLKIAKALGYEEFKGQIKNIINWAANEHYENEKDKNGDLDISIDFLKLLTGKNEIRIGKNYYIIPGEILD